MRAYPAVISHHALTFRRETKFLDDMTFALCYQCETVKEFPQIALKVKATEDTDEQVGLVVEQIHAHVGRYLANFYVESCNIDEILSKQDGQGVTLDGEVIE